MAERLRWRERDSPSAAELRSRLRQRLARVLESAHESRLAGYSQMSAALVDCAAEIVKLLGPDPLPESNVIEGAIARAERAADVWAGFGAF